MTPEHRRVERRDDPPPTGSEYEEYKKAVERRAFIGAIIGVLILLVLVLDMYGTFYKNPQDQIQGDRDAALSRFAGCVESGNPLRGQMRDEFVDLKRKAIIPIVQAQSDLWKRILAFSPPPQTAEERQGFGVVTDNIETLNGIVDILHHRIQTIDERIPNSDCLHRYPPLDGQTYPPDLVKRAQRQVAP